MSLCRDCADYNGTYPNTGQPCDPDMKIHLIPENMTEAQLSAEIRRLEKIAKNGNITIANGKRLHACRSALALVVADSMREAPID